jgi:pyruvate,water dikinase
VTSKVPRGFRLLAFPYRFGRDLYCADVLWTDDFLPRHLESIAEVTTFDLENASKQEVLAFLRRIVEINGTAWAWIIHSALFAKFSEVLFRAAFRVLGPGGSPVLLLAGYPNKSVEADENLWAIARDAEKYSELSTALGASDPSVALAGLTSESARLWLKRVDGWIADYGHRVYDLDMVRETLQDDRPLVLHLIWKFMNITGPSPLQRQRHAEKVRKDEEQRLAEWAGSRPLRRKLLRASLGIAQRYARIRESRPFYLHLGWPVMRRAALCIGAMLCASGVLDNSSDVFFLSVDQLGVCVDAQSDEPAGEAKVIVREARMLWSRRRFFSPPAYLHPSLLFRLMQHAFTRRHPFDSGVLRGVAGSPGRASGFARVLTDQASWRGFRKGDVLIAEVTTPAWTLLFGIASAVVTEKGGSLSHAAIVAREYGIPAVVGVADLLSRVEDGTSVTVDGDAGTIQVHAAQVHQA